MEELHLVDICKISGGYLRISENLENTGPFTTPFGSSIKGGILHAAPYASMRKAKIFPKLPTLLD